MKIAENALELIGGTPLVRLGSIAAKHGGTPVLAKLEKCNPAGSAKDRIALSMVLDAEEKGLIGPGALLIEPTSGNTGVGLAMVAAQRGYTLILTMPASMSKERRLLLSALGARLVLTDPAKGMTGAVEKAQELLLQNPGAFMPSQFENPANPAAHRATAQEILADTDGEVDAFVACVGTGGTVSGTGRALKAAKAGVYVVAVEPAESPLLSGGAAGAHGIQGIGANFIPQNYDASVVDEVMTVSTQEAYAFGRDLARREGLLCGISSGAALAAAVCLSKRPAFSGKKIVVLLPDTGERYLSTPMFEE
jgi:cysteine synthase A